MRSSRRMKGYQNIERKVTVLPEAKKEAKALRLITQLKRLEDGLAKRQLLKGFKKIEPKSANTYEARLTIRYRAYMVFEEDAAIVFKVGDHL